MKAFLGLAVVMTLAGCTSAAKAEDYRWSVKAPPQVALGTKLHFTVEARSADGLVVTDIPYVWTVNWVGLRGSHHQGYSSREETLAAKGSTGQALLQILAKGPGEELREVARATFEVTPEGVPLK